MPYKIPWSNFHELNLDWLLEQVKKLRSDVDDMMGAATPSDEPPMANGTAYAGTSINYSRGDHVHPTDTSRASASALTTETLDRQDADLLLSGRIDTLSARVVPSDAYPLMDGAAESGSHVEYSRRDHRHPTDTSRAAASALTQEITERENADITLQTNIDTVDAKIKFSSTAPLMDSSSASPGFSDYQARADHVHPTDTSRASQSDFDTLKARVDGFAGSANPSDTTPNMDGVGSAGTGGNYSRGDHVHPSDTSKLDKTGGTISGDLAIEGDLTPKKLIAIKTLTAPGWYKAAIIPFIAGTMVTVTITRNETSNPQEEHQFDLFITNTGASFQNEKAIADNRIIDQIRYTSAGILDLHYDQSYTNTVAVDLEIHAPTSSMRTGINAGNLTLRSNTPGGETVILSTNLATNAKFMNRSDIYRRIESYTITITYDNDYAKLDDYTSLNINNDDYCISMVIRGFSGFATYGLTLMKGSDGTSFYVGSAKAGTYTFSVEYWFIKP